MWKKIIELKYLVTVKYIFLGIILSVIAYQFVTKSLLNNTIYFNFLIEADLLKNLIGIIVGGFVGGFIHLLTTSRIRNTQKEHEFYFFIKNKGQNYFIMNMIAFSIGGFMYKFIDNILDLTNYNNLFQTLFSNDHLIEYVGMIISFSVFSIFFSLGVKKRFELLFENIQTHH